MGDLLEGNNTYVPFPPGASTYANSPENYSSNSSEEQKLPGFLCLNKQPTKDSLYWVSAQIWASCLTQMPPPMLEGLYESGKQLMVSPHSAMIALVGTIYKLCLLYVMVTSPFSFPFFSPPLFYVFLFRSECGTAITLTRSSRIKMVVWTTLH